MTRRSHRRRAAAVRIHAARDAVLLKRAQAGLRADPFARGHRRGDAWWTEHGRRMDVGGKGLPQIDVDVMGATLDRLRSVAEALESSFARWNEGIFEASQAVWRGVEPMVREIGRQTEAMAEPARRYQERQERWARLYGEVKERPGPDEEQVESHVWVVGHGPRLGGDGRSPYSEEIGWGAIVKPLGTHRPWLVRRQVELDLLPERPNRAWRSDQSRKGDIVQAMTGRVYGWREDIQGYGRVDDTPEYRAEVEKRVEAQRRLRAASSPFSGVQVQAYMGTPLWSGTSFVVSNVGS